MIRSCLWHSVSQMVNRASRWSSPRDTQRSFDRGPPSVGDGIPVSSRLFLIGNEPTVGSPHRVTVSDWPEAFAADGPSDRCVRYPTPAVVNRRFHKMLLRRSACCADASSDALTPPRILPSPRPLPLPCGPIEAQGWARHSTRTKPGGIRASCINAAANAATQY